MYFLSWLIGWFNYASNPIFLILLLIFFFYAIRRNKLIQGKIFAHQQEVVNLLKEIRDSLKK